MTQELELGKDFFLVPCERQTKKTMRKNYNDWLKNPISYTQRSKANGLKSVKQFSLERIGEQMKEGLNA